jgi:hypothetical protein
VRQNHCCETEKGHRKNKIKQCQAKGSQQGAWLLEWLGRRKSEQELQEGMFQKDQQNCKWKEKGGTRKTCCRKGCWTGSWIGGGQ